MQDMARDRRPLPLALIIAIGALGLCGAGRAESEPRQVAFETSDGGEIHALLYGEGQHAVVLAHGKIFNKESWAPLAPRLAEAELQVLAIDFRGYGSSIVGSEGQKLFLDVIAAMSYLKQQGATHISLLGASMGGGAVARTAVLVEEGAIDRLVLLAPVAIPKPDQMKASQITYITTEGDPSATRTRAQYDLAPEPKSLEILPGDAHAQHIFKTEESEALVELILAALSGDAAEKGFDLSIPD